MSRIVSRLWDQPGQYCGPLISCLILMKFLCHVPVHDCTLRLGTAWYFAPIATMSALLSLDTRPKSLNLWATDRTGELISFVHSILRSLSLADSLQKKQTERFTLSGNILELSVCCCFGRGSLQAFSFLLCTPVLSYWTHRNMIYATRQNDSLKWKQFHFRHLDIPS